MTRAEIAYELIADIEVWLVLGIARDAHPEAVKNAAVMHDRVRDYLGKPRVSWVDYIIRAENATGVKL